MGIAIHHLVIYTVCLALAAAELSLLADAYTRYAPFEKDTSVDLGVSLRAGIIVSSIELCLSFLFIMVGILIRHWINSLWHILLQSFLFVFWMISAVWLQVAFSKVSARDCRRIYGDTICKKGVAIRALAFLLMMLPLMIIPIIIYLEPEDDASLKKRTRIIGVRPVSLFSSSGPDSKRRNNGRRSINDDLPALPSDSGVRGRYAADAADADLDADAEAADSGDALARAGVEVRDYATVRVRGDAVEGAPVSSDRERRQEVRRPREGERERRKAVPAVVATDGAGGASDARRGAAANAGTRRARDAL